MTTAMAAEIAEQPEALARTLDALLPRREEVRRLAGQRRHVLFVARGTSDNAAVYGRYLVEIHAGRGAGLAAPSLATHYRVRRDLTDTLAVSVSQSGQTPTLVSGRGLTYGAALELALKLEETCLRPVRGLSYPDLRHGPIAVVDPDITAMVVATPSGPMLPGRTALAGQLRELVATTLGVGGEPPTTPGTGSRSRGGACRRRRSRTPIRVPSRPDDARAVRGGRRSARRSVGRPRRTAR